MSTYESFQNLNASQKILLAICESKKRLIAWTLYSGSIYKLVNQSYDKLVKIEDSGTAYIEVSSIASITASTYYYDRENATIYLQATGSANPNGRFLVATLSWFFSNYPAKAPHDLATGYTIYFRPIVKSASKFGVELDNQDQIGLAIEGSGTLSFNNDTDFWQSRYDQLTWENQNVKIYSWNDQLAITEAKLIFRGKINAKTYSNSQIQFKLKDLLVDIRQPVSLSNLEDVVGGSIPNNLLKAKQRRIYGRVNGFRPVNIDQLLSDQGYQLTGTFQVLNADDSVTGLGSNFIGEISQDDTLVIAGEDYTVQSVDSDTTLTLSEEYEGLSASGLTVYLKANGPKSYLNREWLIAGHQINEPSTTIVEAFNQNRFKVADITDFFVGDDVYINSEVATISDIYGSIIKLSTNLATVPIAGDVIIRPSVQDVRINDLKLQYVRDYTLDSSTAKLTLTSTAEINISPIRTINGTITFNGTRAVTGSGTTFTKQLAVGQTISLKSQNVFHKILAITDDTNLVLETAGTAGSGEAWYKMQLPFNEGEDILSCSVYGTTDDDTKTGNLLKTGPEIMKDILTKHNLGSLINTASFTKAKEAAPHLLGIAIPSTFSDTRSPTLRDVFQKINFSVFSSLVQNEDFELECNILQPMRPTDIKTFRNYDILSFNIDTAMDRVVKSVNIIYNSKEYDYVTQSDSVNTSTNSSQLAQYQLGCVSEKFIETYLVNSGDARIFASRWIFLLEHGSTIVKFNTKLQASRLQVNDKVEIIHDKFYDRIGGGQQKIAAISSIKKDAFECDVEVEDLGNAFTRVCFISDAASPIWLNATQTEKYKTGFITDQYGLINNDETTFSLNSLW